MAITFGNSGSGNTASFSANNNGNFLFVATQDTSAITAVTYNGVSLTQIGTNQVHTAFGRTMNIWGLVNPAQGSNTLAITGATGSEAVGWISISGVDNTTPTSGFAKNDATTSTPSIAVTTTVNNAYVLAFGLIQNFSSVGSNTTSLLTLVGDPNDRVFRSTSAVTPAGSFTINVNSTGGETAFVAIGINPSPLSSGSFLLNMV